MRVTDKMIFQNAAANAAKSRDRAQTALEQVSTGMRVVHPGDDPTVAAASTEQHLDGSTPRARTAP